MTRSPSTAAASAPLARGTSSVAMPRRRQVRPTASVPRTAWICPSSASSPTTAKAPAAWSLRHPVAARMPRAIGRSKEAPSLRTSAGARFTVIRSWGKAKPALRIAVRTRSRLSRTAESGRPTVMNAGKPGDTSTSTRTSAASTPSRAAESTRASTGKFLARPRRPSMCRIPYSQGRPATGLREFDLPPRDESARLRGRWHLAGARETDSAIQRAAGEAEEALGHEDHHQDEDDPHGNQVILGEEPRKPLAEEQEEGSAGDGPHQRPYTPHHVEDHRLARDEEED